MEIKHVHHETVVETVDQVAEDPRIEKMLGDKSPDAARKHALPLPHEQGERHGRKDRERPDMPLKQAPGTSAVLHIRQIEKRQHLNGRLNRAPDAKPLTSWVKKLPKPIAVFCPNDLRAWQLLQVCKSCGIDVPHEVAILGLDNDVLVCGFSKPMISSIDPNTMEIGRVAMRTLMELIDNPRLARKPIVRQVNPAGVVERASTEVYPINPPWLSNALIFIRKHVQNRLTASEVYAHLNRSHTTVDAAFRRVLNKTVQQTIAAARTEKARHLLLTSDLPIVRIANECGFSSQEYFSRSFSEENGIPPEAWRTRFRTKTTKVP